jgi:hypothetical protein
MFGSEYSDNYLIEAEGTVWSDNLAASSVFNFDAFIADESGFEKDGLTYIRVPNGPFYGTNINLEALVK